MGTQGEEGCPPQDAKGGPRGQQPTRGPQPPCPQNRREHISRGVSPSPRCLVTAARADSRGTDQAQPQQPLAGAVVSAAAALRPGGRRDSCVLCTPPELIDLPRLGRHWIGPWAPEGEVTAAPGPSASARWVPYTRAVCASAENGATGSVWGTRARPQMRDPSGRMTH